MIKYLNSEKQYDEEIKDKLIIVDFYAEWCGPCKIIGNTLEELQNENQDINILKINVDKYKKLAIKFEVMSIPTLLVYKDNKIINRKVGLCNKKEILNLIKEI